MKLELMDKYCGSRVDQAIVKGINSCGRCKSFGPTHIHSLLEPITRRHPFELFAADYLSMPIGVGGFHTIALVMDTFTRFRWGFKLKTKGTAKTTLAALQFICNYFNTPERLMTDGGPHFNCGPVRDYCEKEGIELNIISPYSPWIAGLIKNGNSNLLSILRKLCAPGLGEDDYERIQWKDLPKNWPTHFDHAVRLLNRRLMPSLECSPAELMLGLVINTNPTPISDAVLETTTEQVGVHQAYTQQQCLDGYAHMMDRVHHGYGNTRGVRAAGMAGTGTVWEILTRGYTVPVTAVSRCHTGTIFACCHTVTQPNMALPHLRLLPPNRSLLSLPLPSHFKNKVSHCSIYQS